MFMKITPTKIAGCFVIERNPFVDERGSFARMFCKNELESAGLCVDLAQINLSENFKKGTLRGLHFQKGDAAEDKFVTCIDGEIFDVCVDIREDSPTFGQWVGETLTLENGLGLYVPKGCAHGYLSLTDNSRVLYFTTQFYTPEAESGCRYDDPAFGIEWPLSKPFIMTDKDKNWKLTGELK
jgi:dTDP-4-dehydrorhamnose 3,5-epimerase